MEALTQAPALSLLNFGKPLQLYVTERQSTALGALILAGGDLPRDQLATSQKNWDTVARGWLHCLRVVTAVALLSEEAFKISLGQDVTPYTSHQMGPL